MANKNTVLVFDAAQRSALAVTRSLGALSDTIIITADESADALSASSRFSDLYLQYPSPVNDPQGFVAWLKKTVEQYSVDLLMPMTEISSQLILIYQEVLPKVEMPFSSYSDLIVMADKSNLVEVATANGFRVPKTVFFSSADEIDHDSLDYPCVLKPAFSHIYEDGLWISTQVRILYSHQDLEEALKTDAFLKDHKFMLQEYIHGHGAGVFCYFDRGVEKVCFSHKRLREKPPSGGVSVFSESQQVPLDLRLFATDILKAKNWHGVAMVEFRIDEKGQAYLMEVNTRFWGSLQLAIDAGVDFPLWVYTTQLGLPQPVNHDYKSGVRLRWLLGDLDSLYIYMKSNYSVAQKVKRVLIFMFGNPFGCKHEINRLSDFKPALYELNKYIRDLVK